VTTAPARQHALGEHRIDANRVAPGLNLGAVLPRGRAGVCALRPCPAPALVEQLDAGARRLATCLRRLRGLDPQARRIGWRFL
jgi:hypothetical protein